MVLSVDLLFPCCELLYRLLIAKKSHASIFQRLRHIFPKIFNDSLVFATDGRGGSVGPVGFSQSAKGVDNLAHGSPKSDTVGGGRGGNRR